MHLKRGLRYPDAPLRDSCADTHRAATSGAIKLTSNNVR